VNALMTGHPSTGLKIFLAKRMDARVKPAHDGERKMRWANIDTAYGPDAASPRRRHR
jgi:hypothetical protein